MVKYAREPESGNTAQTCKARGSDLRVHFKNTREAAFALRGLDLKKAKKYLENVVDHKECIPFRRYCGGVGRTAQAKAFKASQGRWPEKSCRFLLDLLTNAESNAEVKGLDPDFLKITHIQVNKAQKQRRRTFRAHGRINAYMANPVHIELILTEDQEGGVKKADTEEVEVKKKRVSKKKLARERLAAGGGGGFDL